MIWTTHILTHLMPHQRFGGMHHVTPKCTTKYQASSEQKKQTKSKDYGLCSTTPWYCLNIWLSLIMLSTKTQLLNKRDSQMSTSSTLNATDYLKVSLRPKEYLKTRISDTLRKITKDFKMCIWQQMTSIDQIWVAWRRIYTKWWSSTISKS